MNFIIINNGKGFNKMFKIMGTTIPQFGKVQDANSFSSRGDAQKVLDLMASNIANDSRIVRDIFNI
jgi:hypothetical protein